MSRGSARKRLWDNTSTELPFTQGGSPSTTFTSTSSFQPPPAPSSHSSTRSPLKAGVRDFPTLSANEFSSPHSSTKISQSSDIPPFDTLVAESQPKKLKLQVTEHPSTAFWSGRARESPYSKSDYFCHTETGRHVSGRSAKEDPSYLPSRDGCKCVANHPILQELASELSLLDAHVHSALTNSCRPSKPTPQTKEVGSLQVLNWAVELLRWNNLCLQDHSPASSSTAQTSLVSRDIEIMKRSQVPGEWDDQFSTTQSSPGQSFPRLPPPSGFFEERRPTYGGSQSIPAYSPQQRAASMGSAPMMLSHSPLQGRRMLPSPSSMTYTHQSTSHSPTSGPYTSFLHTVHPQALGTQISAKTLALQTLQQEHDILLQKLERRRTKCATLEKKFELSDIEINNLTDAKETLEAQVSALETQMEELRNSRDEARRQVAANGTQYMKIMEMASRLQFQGAEEKRKWEAERGEFMNRIKVLEEAMVTGSGASGVGAVAATTESEEMVRWDLPGQGGSFERGTTDGSQLIAVLRAEISRLREKTESLEDCLRTLSDEFTSIQASSQAMSASGRRAKEAASSALAS